MSASFASFVSCRFKDFYKLITITKHITSTINRTTTASMTAAATTPFFVTTLGELHCGDNFEWSFEQNAVSDGSKIEIKEDICNYYKDQGC